jgi:hypothetical protein
MYVSWQAKYDEDEGYAHKYVTVFLAYHMVIVTLIIGMYGVDYALEAVGGVQLAYIVLMIGMRPYYMKSQNVLLVICQIIGLLFTGVLIMTQYISISDLYMCYAVLASEGLLLIGGLLALVRMYIHSKHNERAFKLLHDEEDRLKGKDTFTRNEFKKHQEELQASHIRKPTLREKREKGLRDEKDELAQIKARLKEEHRLREVADEDGGVIF